MSDFQNHEELIAHSEAAANDIVNKYEVSARENKDADLVFSIASTLRKYYMLGRCSVKNEEV